MSNPLDYDRYAYVRNNPVTYNDPSGHWVDDGCNTEGCSLDQKDLDDNARSAAEWRAENERIMCGAGNQAHCGAHPAGIAGFVAAGLVTVGLAPKLPVLIDAVGWQAISVCSQSSICWTGIGASGKSLLVGIARARLQSITNAANSELSADLSLAKGVLSAPEYAVAQRLPGIARIEYSNAIERIVAYKIKNSPIDSLLFRYVGGKNNPDFVGKGLFRGLIFDTTTNLAIPRHIARPYGPSLIFATYSRPIWFYTFP